ncbi:TIGR00266 family protein [Thalassobaculum sp. OXR-137]|uniref:TIGR00266 family protein n=1 Tax=Thalassobaculum sp. OXR-137 TaxID=3100173 RepID=UPI002AC93224|nr:TIGR00266 family protein [Thalassobaculum sp. OXR-137]WPZ36075.1 TIGR00266 family protein [Thalassobaculum sp. OXR-137]
MADEIDYEIEGDFSPMLTITLDPGEAVQAEAGAMVMMEPDITMSTEMPGGFFGSVLRKVSGETFFMTFFTNEGRQRRRVSFASPMPGQIRPLDLAKQGGAFYCQRRAYLASARGIEITVALTKRLSSGLFGGEGLILQKLEGDGWAFLGAGGTLIERQLAKGETLTVDTGCLVGFSATCDYDIAFQRGIKNLVFGGEGLFVTHISGPGTVIIQTQPIAELALALHDLVPKEQRSGE